MTSRLETFAANLKQVVMSHTQKEKEALDDAEQQRASEQNAALERQRQEAAAQQSVENWKRNAAARTKEILDALGAEQKLIIIKDSVWQKKGKIRRIEPDPLQRGPGQDWKVLGGLELVHTYPLPDLEAKFIPGGEDNPPGSHNWRYVQKDGATDIGLTIITRQREEFLVVGSYAAFGDRTDLLYSFMSGLDSRQEVFHIHHGKILRVEVPLNVGDRISLLEEALQTESEKRLSANLLPHQLQERGIRTLSAARQRPAWQKWVNHAANGL